MYRRITFSSFLALLLLLYACSGLSSSSTMPRTPVTETLVIVGTPPSDAVEVDGAILRSADDALARVQEHDFTPEVEGQPMRVIAIRLSSLGVALAHDDWALTNQDRTQRDPNTPIWEVEVDGFVFPHSCPPGVSHCYWNHLIFMLDALRGDEIGMRYPENTPDS
jgi:hypothetical protein